MGFWKKAGMIGLGATASFFAAFGLAYLADYCFDIHTNYSPWFSGPVSYDSVLQSRMFRGKNTMGVILVCVYTFFVGPFIEESVFRSWLRKSSTTQLLTSFWLFVLFVKLCLMNYSTLNAFVTFLLVVVGLVSGWMIQNYFPRVGFNMKFVDEGRKAHWGLILISILGFGYLHTTNYLDSEGEIQFMSPLFFMGFYVLSAYFTWVRLRYGFWWAVFAHGFTNSVVLGLFVFVLHILT